MTNENPSTEIVPQGSTDVTPVQESTTEVLPLPMGGDVVVLARNPEEMVDAQKNLVTWATQKVQAEELQLAEVQENLDHAKKMKIRTEGWARQLRLAKGRVTYYRKIKSALEEGYCIIPNFPIQVIGVRTKKKKPSTPYNTYTYPDSVPKERHQSLPQGEGDYASPEPTVKCVSATRMVNGIEKSVTRYKAQDLQQVDFPFKLVKPQIMSDLKRTMALKIFDEIGVLPATIRQPDPMVIGCIRSREPGRERVISFLINWWVDSRSL